MIIKSKVRASFCLDAARDNLNNARKTRLNGHRRISIEFLNLASQFRLRAIEHLNNQ